MIKSTKTSIKFTNKEKRNKLNSFIDEYRSTISKFVDLLWDEEKIPNLLPKEFTSQISTWLTSRILQCAGKQASAIVRGTQKKERLKISKSMTESSLGSFSIG